MHPRNELQRTVVDKGLCTGCGMCYAVCPNSVIEIDAFRNKGEPIFDYQKCSECNLCLESCPGIDDFLGMSFNLCKSHNIKDECYNIGHAKNIYLTHSMDPQERNNSASGGTASAISRFLLDNNIVDAVIGVGFKNTIKPTPLIIKESKNLTLIAQSKYVRVPLCKVFKDDYLSNSVCFIGLPCHIKAIRKAWEQGFKFKAKIKMLIGLYCGNGLYFEATIALIKKLGSKNYEELKSIQYRKGQWPGYFTLEKKSGEIKSISKMTFNYLSFFYTPKRCYLCNELPSFDADISLGDGWAKEGIDRLGWNCTIARNNLGERIIYDVYKNGYLNIYRIPKKIAINMHRHGMYNKHYLANLRCKLLNTFKIDTPKYANFSARIKDFFPALFTLLSFSVGNLKVSRFLSSLVPFSIYEYLMSSSRKKWKKIS